MISPRRRNEASLTASSKSRGRSTRFAICTVLSFAAALIALAGTGGTATSRSTDLPAANFQVGAYPNSVVVDDFNRDGKADLATANYNSDNVSVLLGNGNVEFYLTLSLPIVCFGPQSILAGDLDGDGNLDFVTGDSRCGNISVLLSSGSFLNAFPYWTAGCPVALARGDFNLDGKLDILVINGEICLASPIKGGPKQPDSPAYLNAGVLFGNGNGTFQNPLPFNAGSGAVQPSVGDFNGDGKLDIAVTNFPGGFVSVFLGNGNGTFQSAVNYAVASRPLGITNADFNGDGKRDLAVASANSTNVSVLLGNGNGSFQTAINYAAGTGALSVIAVDFNGDNKPDLVTANSNDNNVSVLLNNGNGTFQPPINYPVGNRPASVASGDFNGDGRPDLVTANSMSNNVSVVLNCTGLIATAPTSQFFPMNGGAASLNIVSPSTCGWTAVSNDSWIVIVSSDGGSGNATVDYEVRENFSGSARQGTLVVGGSTLTVIQDGGLGEDCNYSISPAFQAFSAGGGAGTVNVLAEERCAWQAVSDVSWITITSGSTAIGNGGVSYSVAANPGPSGRKGIINIAGQTFAVKQKGN